MSMFSVSERNETEAQISNDSFMWNNPIFVVKGHLIIKRKNNQLNFCSVMKDQQLFY